MNADDFVGGHSILALERFMDETRHMIIFDVLSWKSPVGEKGERLRLFLSDVGYAKAQASERRGEIKIRKHAAVIEGHILPDRKKRRHYIATGTQAELLQACPLYETLWNAHIASRDSAEGGADRA